MKIAFVIILTFVSLTCVLSYPNSVPPTKKICTEMVPGHSGEKQTASTNPYQIIVKEGSVKRGGTIEITINGKKGDEFVGYFIQARDANDNPLGEFIPSELVKLNSCLGKRKNGAHHTSNTPKKEVSIKWKAPTDYQGPITFTGSFVKNFETFWAGTKSKQITVA